MHVEIITSLDEFSGLKNNWESVYRSDPHAQLFLSWKWLSGWLPKLRDPWAMLAVRDEHAQSDPFVAFWPIRVETSVDESGHFRNTVKMAGNHVADYTGFISRPQFENRVIGEFARKLNDMNWTVLELNNLYGPEHRTRQFVAHFTKGKFTSQQINRINKSDGVDNSVCPYADLPSTFDGYLASLSANTRQRLRRLIRLFDNEEYCITVADDQTIERDLDILLSFWRKKWAPSKGSAIDGLVRTNRLMLLESFKLGLLYLPIIWLDERPLVGFATLLDEVRGVTYFI